MKSLNKPMSLTWDMDSIFPGGSESKELQTFIEKCAEDVARISEQIKSVKAPTSLEETKQLDLFIESMQSVYSRGGEVVSFVSCLNAQNTKDKKALQLSERLASLTAQAQAAMAVFEDILRQVDEQVFHAWTQREEIAPIAFTLEESRERAKEKLSPELEALVLDLSVDGYHGWSEHYDTIVGKFGIPSKNDKGEDIVLSAGQAANKMHDPDRKVREDMFSKWESTWKDLSDFGADTINRLGGFRLKLYAKRGWDDVLKEPLAINRMSRKTLDAMWGAITESKSIFVKYLDRKAKLLGVDKLSWADVEAPLSTGTGGKISYEDAAETIVREFNGFSPKMSDFAVDAFNRNWIEAEDRPGKRPGGFCTSLTESKETRIFMTFGGTASNVSTLAHELGHAYHQHLMKELPVFSQNYAMNVAETASTFAENILSSAQVNQAKDKEEKIALLEEKVQRSVAFFMNIHARFLFETRFYDKRKSGLLSSEDLCELMEEAQKEAFCGALSTYHPHFWLSKLHFYITDVPFYNFPYTFGFLFSNGLFARAQAEGSTFAAKYDALLQDTGRMKVEDLAMKHLGVDLTKPDFWREAVAVSVADVEQFLQLTE